MPSQSPNMQRSPSEQGLWTPALARPALWLDAADTSTITIATGVSVWRDKSGNNLNATQATSSFQPDYSLTALQGRPGLIFPVVTNYASPNRFLRTPAFSVGVNNIAATFAVARMDSGAEMSRHRRLFVSVDRFDKWYFGTGWESQTMLEMAGIGNQPLVPDWTVGTERNAPFVLSMVGPKNGGVAANNSRARLNGGISTYTRTDATGTVGGNLGLIIGAVEPPTAAGTYSWSGEISEVVHFNSALSSRDVDIVEGYLAWKWGLNQNLPESHPYRFAPPLNNRIITNKKRAFISSIAGRLEFDILSGHLPNITCDLSAAHSQSLSVSGELPAPACDISADHSQEAVTIGELPVPSGNVDANHSQEAVTIGELPVPSGNVDANHSQSISVAGILPVPTGELTDAQKICIDLSGDLPAPTGQITADHKRNATISGNIPMPTCDLYDVKPIIWSVGGSRHYAPSFKHGQSKNWFKINRKKTLTDDEDAAIMASVAILLASVGSDAEEVEYANA